MTHAFKPLVPTRLNLVNMFLGCLPPPPPCETNTLVSVKFWNFSVALAKGGGLTALRRGARGLRPPLTTTFALSHHILILDFEGLWVAVKVFQVCRSTLAPGVIETADLCMAERLVHMISCLELVEH